MSTDIAKRPLPLGAKSPPAENAGLLTLAFAQQAVPGLLSLAGHGAGIRDCGDERVTKTGRRGAPASHTYGPRPKWGGRWGRSES